MPVVRGCDTASLDELAAEVDRLAEAARAGTLKPEELRGGTFTVTSAGKLGGLFVTPLVNHPEVGDPRHRTGSARAPSSVTGRSSSAGSATSRSRSTIASSTGRGRRRSRWT